MAGELDINVVGKHIESFYERGLFMVQILDDCLGEWEVVGPEFGLNRGYGWEVPEGERAGEGEGRPEFGGRVFMRFPKCYRR